MAGKKVSTSSEKKKGAAPATTSGGELSPFNELRRRMDALFEDFSQGWPRGLFDFHAPALTTGLGKDIIGARFDVTESDKAMEITAELPGMDEKDVELTISGGLLTVKGEKKAEKEVKKKDYHLSERHYGSIFRSFRLPDNVDGDKAKASFDKGVLKISLPKKPDGQRKEARIPITKG